MYLPNVGRMLVLKSVEAAVFGAARGKPLVGDVAGLYGAASEDSAAALLVDLDIRGGLRAYLDHPMYLQ